ncbi:uncharacterized protein LOC133634246 [Entelurus aequoreus]|uniref:uncharacterized protein LOC133634246 n=1 Tax=Entelurus aequoreus TaxID=161455 RepID=UPI002B1E7769|nr:uncharacterized protein LOC133634246 [Entelurus aequoreus]
MAETERSLCEYREKHGGERDGEGLKAAPPLRGMKIDLIDVAPYNLVRFMVIARKQQRLSVPHRTGLTASPNPLPATGPGQIPQHIQSHQLQLSLHPGNLLGSNPDTGPCPGHQPGHLSPRGPFRDHGVYRTGGTGSFGYRPGQQLLPTFPNCRIREVHCGSQVRLVVIAIRDITKGEEITVDYSLTEWGENLGFRGSMSAAQQECNSESNNLRKEEEPVSLTPQRHQRQKQRAHQDFVTPSWSLSPSSSPISHSDASESDAADEDNASPRGRTPRRRRRRRGTPSKKKTPNRTPPASSSHPLPSPQPPSSPPSSASTKPVFKAPALLDSGSVSTNGQKGGVSIDAMRQSCDYCGRHFRSLGRHLDKHHSHQPDVCSALVERYTQMHNASPAPAPAHTQHHPRASEADPAERSGVQDLSLSPPPAATAKQSGCASPSLTPPPGQSAVPVSVLKRSPPPVAATPPKKGGAKRLKRERKEEEEECAQSFRSKGKEEEEEEEVDDESGTEEKDKDSLSSGRHQMLPLLSSLSSLVLYLRRLQHSAFLSLSRQLQSAEAWRLLCHSSLALLILYNRRRECEVSKLSITEYRARVTPQCPVPVPPGSPPALTPLEASLSPFERLVLPHLPRVGVQGKRGRIQPLILPPHCEPCLELLLQTRQDVGVDPANQYVFARPYHSPATPLRGTDLLRSLARSSGTRNPRALTQTRVRRQVAILTQLLLLGEGEEPGQPEGSAVERLEHFLEREYHVTQNCADIGQDPGLMGSVGRVVLCGERDGVLFRGMSLNHICLELDVMSGNSADSYSEGESEGEQKEKPEPPALSPSPKPAPTLLYVRKGKNNGRVGRPKKLKNSQAPPQSATPTPPPLPVNRRRGSGKRGVLKRPWSEAERAAVEEHLTRNINELRVPAKADCERCLQQCPLLVSNQRDWRAIKFYCHNRIQLLKKNQRRESELQPLAVC